MSNIDEAIAAIKAAEENVSEVVTAIGVAVSETEEAQQALLAAGAEGSAQLMAKAKEVLDQAVAACNNVTNLLEEATSAAQEAV